MGVVMRTSGVTAVGEGSPLASGHVATWWEEISPALSRLTQWMESRETWIVEPDAEFLALLEQLVERVNQPEFVQAMESSLAPEASELFAMLGSARFLRLLDMMDRRVQGIVTRLVYVFGQLGGDASAYANLFFERLLVVHRCELLGQIFSQRRTESIASAVRMVCDTRGQTDDH